MKKIKEKVHGRLVNASMIATKKPWARRNSVDIATRNMPGNTGTKREAHKATLMVINLQFVFKKQTTYIKSMIAQVLRNSRAGSDSESDGDEAGGWTKGLSSVQQMCITQEFKKNQGYDLDDEVNHIDPNTLNALKKKCKKGREETRETLRRIHHIVRWS
mmetsp:Transcript_35439/g.38354  ORF Transcript_35439/g.38354 Transcript_35439/m.38354 type:complete len:160 (+) Transcript_35439:272-751(+)